ncbi:MAG: type 4a pilus biogenesis protein PilO [Patescibacteria group bacterium]|nr:type 4a pilus biogenesis protein PilO [Patescibacteria group bacterium]
MKIQGHKSIIIIGGALIIIVGLLVFAFLPLNRTIDDLKTQILGKRIDSALLKQQQNTAARSQDEASLVEKDEELRAYFIQKSKFLEFISQIEELAKNNSVKEEVTLTEFPNNTQEVFTHPISVSFTGDYNNILKLMAELESLNYYLDFAQITLSNAGDGGLNVNTNTSKQSQLQVSLTGLTYWQK